MNPCVPWVSPLPLVGGEGVPPANRQEINAGER